VPLSIAGGLAIALMLNRRVRFVGLYRTLVFVPYIMSATAQGVLFSFVFDSQFGVANSVLHHLGIASQGFLQDPGQALWVLVLIGLWSGIGFSVVVYLAALQDIPPELVEAASIDGARRWGVLRHVVLPALNPVTVFLFVWQTFESLQLFDLVFVTTRGGRCSRRRCRALRVAAGVPVLQRRLRRGGGLRARVRAAGRGARVGLVPAAAAGAAGMRISRWHLVLAPMALIFALPLLWLTVSSFMTNAQINTFPPEDHPRRAAPRRLPLRVPDRRLRPLVPELDDRGRGHGGVEPRVLLVRRLRVRAHALPRLASRCWR
jgi:ABC-type glycerol-3-phosphate transport system permease component